MSGGLLVVGGRCIWGRWRAFGERTCAAMKEGLLAVGSTVHSMTLSYSQLLALREFP